MSWEPTPGTIPALAIEHLRKLPAGTRVPTAVLADAIGHDARSLAAYLSVPRDMAWLCNERIASQRMSEWWLGPAAFPAAPVVSAFVNELDADGSEIAEKRNLETTPQPEQINMPPARKRPGPRRRAESLLPLDPTVTLKAVAAGSHKRVPLPEPVEAPAAAPDLGDGSFVCGLFSDGVLVMYQEGQRMVLQRPALETLLHFLERMCVEEAA